MELFQEYLIMATHMDLPSVEYVYTCYDEQFNLRVVLDHVGYDHDEDFDFRPYSCSVSLCVDKDEAYTLARRLKVSMVDLPRKIAVKFEEYGYLVAAGYEQAQYCFWEISQYLLEQKCHFKVERRPGKDGYMCC